MSVVEISKGVEGVMLNILFLPRFPKSISKSPSSSKSTNSVVLQSPVASFKSSFSRGLNPSFWFKKICIPVKSPTITRSSLPSWFKSPQLASLTIPISFIAGKTVSSANSNTPSLLTNRKLLAARG
ncbi:MAG: Uncharacterised protein [Formosa sp. Hel3_A1_48]|nr:MAG: Uncharacterised protein [Formosa sp. Hel3_A1_48]